MREGFSLGGNTEWAKIKVRGREQGVMFLRRYSKPPPHQLGVWGSLVSSTSRVRGGALTAQRFTI